MPLSTTLKPLCAGLLLVALARPAGAQVPTPAPPTTAPAAPAAAPATPAPPTPEAPVAAPVAPAAAPAAPAVAREPFRAAVISRADTARAIRKLFKSRRGGGIGWFSFGTAWILASSLPALQETSAGIWWPGVSIGTGFTALGLKKRFEFTRRRERRVLRELAATGRVPESVARRLRGNFTPVPGPPDAYDPLSAPGIRPAESRTALTPEEAREAARADTLRALNRLFERRRRGGGYWCYSAGAGVLSMVRALSASSTQNPNVPVNTTTQVDGTGLAVMSGILIGAPLIIGISNLSAYSEAKQQAVVQSFQAGQPLPAKVRQRLKRKDFESYD